VTDEFVSEELPMFDSVLFDPEIDLFVRVSVPARVDNVPAVGSVKLVLPVAVRLTEKAPEVVKDPAVDILPPSVVVKEPLLTPVPPLAGFKMPPRTTTPVVGLDGVKPVDPALNEDTPPAWLKEFHEPFA
jgi:hypothetical protein